MKRNNNVIYINKASLSGIANRWFSGSKEKAKEALLALYADRTIRFSETWRKAC